MITQIVFAIYYLLGVVLVPGAWVRGTRNFVESRTGESFGFEQEGSYIGARFSLPEIKIKYIQRAILTFCIQGVVGGVFNLARLVVVSGLDHSIVRTDKLTDNDRSHGRTSPNNVPPRMSLNYKGIPVDRIDGSYAIL